MTSVGAWNSHRHALYYGSLPPVDERSALMLEDHDHGHQYETTPTKNDKTTKGKHSKRLVAFLSILAVISTTTSTLFLVVFISQSENLGLSFFPNSNNDDDNNTADAPWWQLRRFHVFQSAQQVADEALERMNNRLLLERNSNNAVSTGSSSSTNLATAAAVGVAVSSSSSSSSPDNTNNNALLNLNENYNDNSKKLKEGCEATVVIVRHCEKAHIREHCAYIGYERSVYLASLFGDDHDTRWPMPSFIFALAPGGRNSETKMNFREIETAGPLALKSGVKVNYAYDQEDDRPLAQHVHTLLHSGEMCGKVAFIAWKHSRIGHLAHLLGCGPKQHCPIDYKGTTFDPAWTIQFSYRHLLHSENKHLTHPDRKRHAQWYVTGSVQYENFDPLAFSKRSGDYPRGGRSTGASWEDRAAMIPERKKRTSKWLEADDVVKPNFLGVGPPYDKNKQQQQHDNDYRHDDYWRNKD